MMVNKDNTGISLRAVEPADADFLYEVENDSAAWRYSDTVAPLSRKILRQYSLEYEADPFAARQLRLIISVGRNDSSEPVGAVDLYEIDPVHRRAFVGIYILPRFRGERYGAMALGAIESYALNVLNLRLLAARIESGNDISLRLFENAGFHIAATIPDWFILPGGGCSNLIVMTKPLC